MKPLYNYGISQEDILSEAGALEIEKEDSVLCIASGGEIPLNMAALHDVNICAVDSSLNQIRLCRFKQAAATFMEPFEAASLLGYMPMAADQRENIYRNRIRSQLLKTDQVFWDHQIEAVQKGVINAGRFESYIKKFSALALSVVGKKNFWRLFESENVAVQNQVFDKNISRPLLKNIFKVAFHPRIYRKRGIDPQGLTHGGNLCMAEFFFQRFKNFCCNTLARNNYYLQYIFFNRLLFDEALPEFLQPSHHEKFIKNQTWIRFHADFLQTVIEEAIPGRFNKIHLSNLGDWMSEAEMTHLFRLVGDKLLPGAKTVLRFIHQNHKTSLSMSDFAADYDLGDQLLATDRFPFYSIVPLSRLR